MMRTGPGSLKPCAASAGQLGLDELERRLDAAVHAATVGELAVSGVGPSRPNAPAGADAPYIRLARHRVPACTPPPTA